MAEPSGLNPLRRDVLKSLLLAAPALALPSLAHAAGLTLADIKTSGVLRVGMALSPPNELQALNGDWYGFNPDLVQQLAKSWGVKVDFVSTTWGVIVPGLLAHKYDMIGGAMSATAARKEVINFSDPYQLAGQMFVVNKNNPKHLTSIEALNKPSTTVAYVQNSIEGTIVNQLLPNATERALTSSSVGDLIAELEAGRSDAICITSVLREPILSKFPWAATVPDNDIGVNPTPVVWGFRKEDSGLLDAVNVFLARANKDGTVSALMKKDFTPVNSGLA